MKIIIQTLLLLLFFTGCSKSEVDPPKKMVNAEQEITDKAKEIYPRCVGSYEYEKCVNAEKKLLEETDQVKAERTSRLEKERNENLELANKEMPNSSKKICTQNVKNFLVEIAAENGVYLDKAECSYEEVINFDLVKFDFPNSFDSWMILISYNPSSYQFVKGTQWLMCIQKINGNLVNVGKKCS